MRYILFILTIILSPLIALATSPITGTTSICQFATTTLSDATPGGTWSTSNSTIAGVSAAGVVTGNSAGTATITYTETSGSATVTISVIASPLLTSATLASICDSTTFNYFPTSDTPTANFDWSRAVVTGIYEIATMGADNPNEQLINTTFAPVVAQYVYTVTAPFSGCSSTQTVAVTVNPAIRLSTPLSSSICSGDLFSYTPVSATSGTTFSWTRTTTKNILPATASGTGAIIESLTDTTTANVTVSYKFKLSANGCLARTPEYVQLTVFPQPCKLGFEEQTIERHSGITPNPSDGTFSVYIASPLAEKAVMIISDMMGRVVKQAVVNTNTATETRLDAPSGVYMLNARSASTRYSDKIIVTGK